MPLFASKFSPKPAPVRRREAGVVRAELGERAAAELALEAAAPRLSLGDLELTFEDGQWIPASGRAGAAHREAGRLRRAARRLEAENNMLRLKFELLLDLAADAAAGDARRKKPAP